jgi:hypothetical protein
MPPKQNMQRTSSRRAMALKAKKDQAGKSATARAHALTAFSGGGGGEGKKKGNSVLSRFARKNVAGVRNKRRVRVISGQSIDEAVKNVDDRENSLDEYLAKTLLKKRIVDAMHELVHLEYLPRNPYAFLAPYIRRQEIQADLQGRRVTSTFNKIVPAKAEQSFVTNIRDNYGLFGIGNLLKFVDHEVRTAARWWLFVTAVLFAGRSIRWWFRLVCFDFTWHLADLLFSFFLHLPTHQHTQPPPPPPPSPALYTPLPPL